MESDSPIVAIVVEELLAYKPRLITLHDRYLQLETILDAIDKARGDKNDDRLVLACKKIGEALASTSSRFNFLERCISEINARITTHHQLTNQIPQAKL